MKCYKVITLQCQNLFQFGSVVCEDSFYAWHVQRSRVADILAWLKEQAGCSIHLAFFLCVCVKCHFGEYTQREQLLLSLWAYIKESIGPVHGKLWLLYYTCCDTSFVHVPIYNCIFTVCIIMTEMVEKTGAQVQNNNSTGQETCRKKEIL